MKNKIICNFKQVDDHKNEKNWDDLEKYILAYQIDGKRTSNYYTEVKCFWDRDNLYLRFLCEDYEILADYQERNSPIYDQETVEVFVAPDSLHCYYEINLSPRNVVFTSRVKNNLRGSKFSGDENWGCQGLSTAVKNVDIQHVKVGENSFGPWKAYFQIPFSGLNKETPEPGDFWAINLFRIKREPFQEFICWQPAESYPPNFHVPKKFGFLIFA